MATKKPTGSTKYTDALVTEICDRVANGTPLREICREEGKPSWTTFYNWINSDDALFERFTRARELGTDAIAEDAIAILDAIPERIDGGRMDSAYVQWQKNRVEMRLKLLAKWNPRKYGDKTILAGDKENPVVTESTVGVLDAALINLERKLQVKNEE
jgi:hypothetical protein